MRDILIIDSNIWAYYFDRDAPEHARVSAAVDKALKSEQIGVNTLIAMEVAHLLIRNLGPVKGQSKVAQFLGFPMVVADFDYGTLLDSVGELAMNSHFGVGGRDATLLASMKRLGWRRIMTHDSALKKIDWLDVHDPAA